VFIHTWEEQQSTQDKVLVERLELVASRSTAQNNIIVTHPSANKSWFLTLHRSSPMIDFVEVSGLYCLSDWVYFRTTLENVMIERTLSLLYDWETTANCDKTVDH
jgi:hypothetical protein